MREQDEALKRGNSSAKAEGVGEHKRVRDYRWEDCRARAALETSDGKSGPGSELREGPCRPNDSQESLLNTSASLSFATWKAAFETSDGRKTQEASLEEAPSPTPTTRKESLLNTSASLSFVEKGCALAGTVREAGKVAC